MARVLIVGNGTIGTFLGISLKAAGNEVKHLLRQGKRAYPVSCQFRDMRRGKYKTKQQEYPYQSISDPKEASSFDFIFVPVGSFDLRQAVKSLMPFLKPEQYLILVGNLWEDVDYLKRYYPGRYVFAFPHFGGTIHNRILSGWLTQRISIGELEGVDSFRLNNLNELLTNAGFKPEVKKDMRSWLLTHFAWKT